MDYHQEVFDPHESCTRTRSNTMCLYRNMSLPGVIVLLLCLTLIPYSIALSPSSTAYLDKLLQQYGSNEALSVHQLRNLIDNVIAEESGHGKKPVSGDSTVIKSACNWTDVDWAHSVPECAVNTCLSANDMFAVQDVEINATLNRSHLHDLGPMLMFEAQKNSCQLHEQKHSRPPSGQTWGYGFLFVTIINICSLVGVIVLPVMKKKIYKQVLMTLVGLAVGSLVATGIIVLIPKAWGLVSDDPEVDPVPRVMMCVTVFGGIYLFFLLERFLRLIMEIRKKMRHESSNEEQKNHDIDEDVPVCSVIHKTPQSLMDLTKLRDPSLIPDSVQDSCVHPSRYQTYSDEANIINGSSCANSFGDSQLTNYSKIKSKNNGETKSNGDVLSAQHNRGDTEKHGHSHDQGQQIASVAWMIIFGDALHNFIDGLSIGAAFTESLMSGVSVSIAVICEELPHELGDFAILLKSGMSLKQALFYNFLSATTCYLGLMVGIVLGENTGATLYIFAMAGGMFLYISLVDMVPEMNNAAEEEEKALGTTFSLRVFVLQNLGIITGFSIITLMSIYDRHIDFEGS